MASKIVECIINHSSGNAQTPFIEADGGLCLVARQWNKFSERPLTIFDRNSHFSDLHKHWFPKNSNIPIRNINIHSYHNAESLPPLTIETVPYRNGWHNPVPGYTLFATSTLSMIKYLVFRCSQQWQSKNQKLLEFHNIRPEFFLLVWPKTTNYLTMPFEKKKNLKTFRMANLAFRVMFECQKIQSFPIKALFPWSPTTKIKDGEVDLIKIRPKEDIGLNVDDKYENYEFWFFLQLLEFPRGKKFIDLMEDYFPGIGLDLILEFNLTVKTSTKEIHPNQIVPIFRLLISQQDFKMSNFAVSAYLTFIGKM